MMNLQLISRLTIASLMLLGAPAFAQSARKAPKRVDVSKDVDTLGGNQSLMQMAQALDPENRARIVQNRTVDRYNRLELGVNYGGVAGGDPYVKTQSLGLAADFHLNPRFALGLRYNDFGNDLTPEGQRVFDKARNNRTVYATGVNPDIDAPQRSGVAIASWFPIYGKINLFDSGIAQFDIYLLGGGGQIQLANEGWTTLYTAGGGVGFWINNRVSLRMEARYQNYHDKISDGIETTSRTVNGVIASGGIGFML